MTATMYDSTSPEDIPPVAEVVAGYIDGAYAWSAAGWARFPDAKRLEIAVTFTDQGDCLDIENGDATLEQAPAWVRARQAAGLARPWLYINRDNWAALQQAIAAQLGPGTAVGYWVADWTGEPHELPGADATQFANPPASGGHFDLSVVTGTLPTEPSQPAPPPPPPAPAPAPEPPAPAPQPTPEGLIDVNVPELRQGSAGGAVRAVQSILNGEAGAHLAVDGDFGPDTEGAVKAWQTFWHLEADGIVGPATWSTLLAI